MPVSDGIVEGGTVLPASTFDSANGWALDTTAALDGEIIGNSTAYQARDGQLKAGYYDQNVQSYASKTGENNRQVNGEQCVSYAPGGTLSHLTAFSKRPRPAEAPAGPDELVITSRPPTEAEQDAAHYAGYYVANDGQNARISYFTAENGFPDGPPAAWDLQSSPTTENPDPLAFFGKVPANVIGGHLSTNQRFASSFCRARIVCRMPSGGLDLSNTAPRETGQTYNGKSAESFFEPQDLGASHRDIRGHFPAASWGLEHNDARADINGVITEGSTQAHTPGDIALSPSRFETDTVEGFGFSETSAWQTVHFFDDTNNDGRITNAKFSASPAPQVDSLGNFHEYLIDITPEKIGIAIDGVYTTVIDTPRPQREPKPVFVKRPGLPFLPDIDENGNAKIERGQIQRHADGSPRYSTNFFITNLVDPAKFIRAFIFNELTHPSASNRANVPTYNPVDELVIREWEIAPLAVDNPDKFGVERVGNRVATPSTPSANPVPPPPVCQVFPEEDGTSTVYGIPASDDVVSMNFIRDGDVVATLTEAPYVWVDENRTGSHNYRTFVVGSTGESARSSQITIPPATTDEGTGVPPTVILPDTAGPIPVGGTIEIPVTVTDDEPGLVIAAESSEPSILRVDSVSATTLTVTGLAPGSSTLSVTGTDATQTTTGTLTVLVIAVQANPTEPDAPTFTLSESGGTVRVTINAPVTPVTHEIRRNEVLIATLRPDVLIYDDPNMTVGTRTYEVRAVNDGFISEPTTDSITLAGKVGGVNEGLTSFDVFALESGEAIVLGPVLDRLTALEAGAGSAGGGGKPLILFETTTERDAFALAYEGLHAGTLSGVWAVRTNGTWVAQSKASVLVQIDGSEVYGTIDDGIAANKARIEGALDVPSRIFRYTYLG